MVLSRCNKRDAGLHSAPETQGTEGMLLLSVLLHSHFLEDGAGQMRNCPLYSGGCMLVTPSLIIPHRHPSCPSFLATSPPLPSSPHIGPSAPSPQGRGGFPVVNSDPPRGSRLWKVPSGWTRLQHKGHRAGTDEQSQELFPSTFWGGARNKINLCPFSLGGCSTRCLVNTWGGEEDFGSTVGFCPDT